MKEDLEAEAAADIAGANAHLLGLHAERLGNLLGNADRPLRSAPDIQRAVLRPRRGDHRPCFHRIDDDPVVDNVDLENFAVIGLCRRGQRRVGARMVARHPVEGDVVRIFVIKLRRPVCDRRIDVGNRRHAVIADVDQFKRVMRGCRVLRHHDGDNVAGGPVHPAHHRRVRDKRHLLAILVPKAILAMDFADAVGIQIRLRGDKMNAVERRRAGGIDRHEPGMRKRRPQERHGKPFAGFQIIRIPTASGQKPRVLQPWNGLTDAEFHVRLLFCIPCPTGTGETPRQCGLMS